MTVVVTGASGFVGSRLVGVLPGARAVVRAPVAYLPAHGQVVADLLGGDDDALAAAFAGADSVVHLAGRNEVESAADPAGAVADTVAMAWRVAAAAAAAGARRLVYVSTIHVYGPGAAAAREDVVPGPRTPYAVARLAAEHLVAGAGLDVVVLRLSNAVGAPADPAVDRWSLVAADLARQAATTGRLRLRSDGTQRRDFVALADVCATIAAASSADTDAGALPAGTYNLASGHATSVLDLAAAVADAVERRTGSRPPVEPGPEPGGAHRAADVVDVGRLAAVGLAPPAGGLAAGVDELVAFCLEHREGLRCRSTA